ncbi:phage tail assembly protein T [Zavarzinella formosa]|uniref:phage tail assembly protein T n=1 Tax=Zavarzinella formosa TaxID=360055 RepID=UPI00037B46F9|nr:hypothetical protein [Zavarzinella formosa]
MGRSVEELQQYLSSTEWVGWQAFYACEPFGPIHDDERMAELTATLWRVNGVKTKTQDFTRSEPPHSKRAIKSANDELLSYFRTNCPALAGT